MPQSIRCLTSRSAALALCLGVSAALSSPLGAQDVPRAAPVGDAVGAPGGRFEAPALADAAALLPPELLAGPHHRVRPGVRTDGYMAWFVIDSDFGTFTCGGRWKVAQRVKEIAALAQLAEMSKGEVFADALKQSMNKPVDAVVNVAQDPVGSVKRLPGTIGHFFRRTGAAIAEGAQAIADSGSESGAGAGTASEVTGAAKGAIGFNKALLECARKLEVDPYTDNAVLADRMEEISWVFFAGGLPLRLGVAAASGGASLALNTTVAAGLPEELYVLTPAELLVRTQDDLAKWGVPAETGEAFIRNPALSPSVRWSILRSLERLAPGPGRVAAIEVASTLDAPAKAEFLDQSLRLLVAVPGSPNGPQFTEVMLYGRLPAGRDASGGLWVPAAVDHVTWTPQVAEFAGRSEVEATSRTLCLPKDAILSERAQAGLAEAGWKILRF